jgi:hypothetical protein
MIANDLSEALWSLSLEDRVGMLIVSIIEHDPEAIAAVNAMIAMTLRMSKGLSVVNRVCVAERLRDAADTLEQFGDIGFEEPRFFLRPT